MMPPYMPEYPHLYEPHEYPPSYEHEYMPEYPPPPAYPPAPPPAGDGQEGKTKLVPFPSKYLPPADKTTPPPAEMAYPPHTEDSSDSYPPPEGLVPPPSYESDTPLYPSQEVSLLTSLFAVQQLIQCGCQTGSSPAYPVKAQSPGTKMELPPKPARPPKYPTKAQTPMRSSSGKQTYLKVTVNRKPSSVPTVYARPMPRRPSYPQPAPKPKAPKYISVGTKSRSPSMMNHDMHTAVTPHEPSDEHDEAEGPDVNVDINGFHDDAHNFEGDLGVYGGGGGGGGGSLTEGLDSFEDYETGASSKKVCRTCPLVQMPPESQPMRHSAPVDEPAPDVSIEVRTQQNPHIRTYTDSGESKRSETKLKIDPNTLVQQIANEAGRREALLDFKPEVTTYSDDGRDSSLVLDYPQRNNFTLPFQGDDYFDYLSARANNSSTLHPFTRTTHAGDSVT